MLCFRTTLTRASNDTLHLHHTILKGLTAKKLSKRWKKIFRLQSIQRNKKKSKEVHWKFVPKALFHRFLQRNLLLQKKKRHANEWKILASVHFNANPIYSKIFECHCRCLSNRVDFASNFQMKTICSFQLKCIWCLFLSQISR